MAKGIDRRAARTRRMLHEALIALILRKGYEAITVQDIIDAADVGRSTFYAHYGGKEDLLRGGFEELRTLLAAEARAAPPPGPDEAPGPDDAPGPQDALRFSRALFEHACDYKQVYRALVGSRGAAVAINEIRRILADRVRKDLSAGDGGVRDDGGVEDGVARDGIAADGGGGGAVPRELRVQFVVGTFMTVLTWCLERRHGLPPAQIDAIFRRLVLGGIGAPGRG